MHAAIAEVGILYATGQVHDGWGNVGTNGRDDWNADRRFIGRTRLRDRRLRRASASGSRTRGATIGARTASRNSTYDDWLANGTDVWVARLGAPIDAARARVSVARRRRRRAGHARLRVLRPAAAHHQHRKQRRSCKPDGTYGTSEGDVREIFTHITEQIQLPKGPKRLLLYAHGGLTAEDSAIQKVADSARPAARCGRLSDLAHLEDGLLDDAAEYPARRRRRDVGLRVSRQREGLHARPAGRRP